MTASKKIFFSFVFSIFLVAVIILLAYTGIFGFVENNFYLSFTRSEKIIMLVLSFLTIFLTIFFIFNIRQYPMTIFHNRLKDMQIHFIEVMYERTGKVDWAQWSGDYKLWREDIQSVLKNDLNKEKDIITESGFDMLIDKSWDGMFSVLGDGSTGVPPEEAVDNPENENNTAAHTGGLLAAATAIRMRGETVSVKPLKNSNTRPADDDIPGKIIFEQDGIHYINNDLLYHSGNTGGKLDGDFQKLVESVVDNGVAG